MMLFARLPQNTKIIISIQALALIMGTCTHVIWIEENGFLSENYHASIYSCIFWDSLTFLDPLAAILLIIRPKIGIFLTLGIISADVIHNNLFYQNELYFSSLNLSDWIVRYWMIIGQILFLLFVVITFRRNRRHINEV